IWGAMARLQSTQGGDERVDVVIGVVERQGRPNRRLQAEAPQDGLGTMMSRAYGDAFLVEQPADLFSLLSQKHEREHAGLLRRSADERQPRHRQQPFGRVGVKLVLVAVHVAKADA